MSVVLLAAVRWKMWSLIGVCRSPFWCLLCPCSLTVRVISHTSGEWFWTPRHDPSPSILPSLPHSQSSASAHPVSQNDLLHLQPVTRVEILFSSHANSSVSSPDHTHCEKQRSASPDCVFLYRTRKLIKAAFSLQLWGPRSKCADTCCVCKTSIFVAWEFLQNVVFGDDKAGLRLWEILYLSSVYNHQSRPIIIICNNQWPKVFRDTIDHECSATFSRSLVIYFIKMQINTKLKQDVALSIYFSAATKGIFLQSSIKLVLNNWKWNL